VALESALRSDSIQFVLNQICHHRANSTARDAAKRLVEEGVKLLVVKREPRTFEEIGTKHPRQRVLLEESDNASAHVDKKGTASTLIIPIGNLLSRLRESMDSAQ
jgi:hypothetical protein